MLLTAYLTVKYIKIRLYNLRIIKHLYRYRSCPTLCYCKHNTTRKHVLLLVKIVFHNIMKLPDRIFFFFGNYCTEFDNRNSNILYIQDYKMS